MRTFALCTLFVVLTAGMTYAQPRPRGPRYMEPTECAPLKTLRLLELDREQHEESRSLADNFRTDYAEEVAEIEKELNQEYAEKSKHILKPDQKERFEALRGAEEKYKKAVEQAQEQYRNRLKELFYSDEEQKEAEDEKPGRAGPRLRFLPKSQKDLLVRFASANDEFRSKNSKLRTRHARKIGAIYHDQRDIDWKNPKKIREWRKNIEKRKEKANKEYVNQARDAMNEKQSETFSAAVQAMKKWEKGTTDAEKAFINRAIEILGKEKKREIERHLRMLSHEMRR